MVSVLVSVWTPQTLTSLLHTQLGVVAGGGIGQLSPLPVEEIPRFLVVLKRN